MNSYTGPSLTVAALAYREGEHLRKCFASLKPLLEITGAKTLILLDSNADSLTRALAQKLSRRVANAHFDNFAAQRNRALDLCDTDWVFFIDPDERMTLALAEEIAGALQAGHDAAHRVPRRNILFKHEVRHTGWSPDYQIRLLKRDSCRYNENQQVHELPHVRGSIGTLHTSLVHFNYDTWGQFFAKQLAYAPMEARALYAEGHRVRPRSLLGQPLREFKRRFIDYRGYRDGLLGLKLAVAMAAYRLLTYLQLLKIQRADEQK